MRKIGLSYRDRRRTYKHVANLKWIDNATGGDAAPAVYSTSSGFSCVELLWRKIPQGSTAIIGQRESWRIRVIGTKFRMYVPMWSTAITASTSAGNLPFSQLTLALLQKASNMVMSWWIVCWLGAKPATTDDVIVAFAARWGIPWASPASTGVLADDAGRLNPLYGTKYRCQFKILKSGKHNWGKGSLMVAGGNPLNLMKFHRQRTYKRFVRGCPSQLYDGTTDTSLSDPPAMYMITHWPLCLDSTYLSSTADISSSGTSTNILKYTIQSRTFYVSD